MRRCEPSWSCIHFLGGVMLGTLRGEAEVLDAVRVLPGEQVDFPIHVLVHVAPALGRAAEVAVCSGGAVDRMAQIQRLIDAEGRQVEYVADRVFDGLVGHDAGAERVDHHRDGLGDPDGVRHLDRKSTRLNSSHGYISYAVFCLKKKKNKKQTITRIVLTRFSLWTSCTAIVSLHYSSS